MLNVTFKASREAKFLGYKTLKFSKLGAEAFCLSLQANIISNESGYLKADIISVIVAISWIPSTSSNVSVRSL